MNGALRPAAAAGSLGEVTWPLRRVAEAVERLGRAAGVAGRSTGGDAPYIGAEDAYGEWLEGAAGRIGLEVEAVELTYADVDVFLRRAAPALARVETPEGLTFLAIASADRRGVVALGPDGRSHRLTFERVHDAVCDRENGGADADVDALLEATALGGRERARARRALRADLLAATLMRDFWLVREPPSKGFVGQLRRRGVGFWLTSMAASHALAYSLFVASWWLLGNGVLNGRADLAILAGWALVLLSYAPLQVFTEYAQGKIALEGGALLKQRLLAGALELDLDDVRSQGAGQLFGRVVESDALEALALAGGFQSLMACIESVAAGFVLWHGANGPLAALALVTTFAFVGVLGWRMARARAAWTRARLDVTDATVERMLGHRTRLVQQTRGQWHDAEDLMASEYLSESQAYDRRTALLAAAPRVWLVAGLACSALALATGRHDASLLVGLGGVLLGYQAFQKLSTGLTELAGAAIAARQVVPMFRAGATAITAPALPAAPAAVDGAARAGRVVLEASDVEFRYRNGGRPVLDACSLRVHAGERVLIEGASGGGKSTLGMVLCGLRSPSGGLVSIEGLDRATLGRARWRQRVAGAPQFHQNHVFSASLSFNVLMGRQWPPRNRDKRQAEALCRELGLGPLLDRMPGGMEQMLGDTGWQLSHGEKSRVFIARALMQNPEVLVLDESFAALDPETLETTMRVVQARASTLLVIAHP